ncbi:MAG: phytanoyl-CoA dioxygenase family protein [Candidatus Latescibacterota bacterium]|nr:phytanoyl-CoA dioxygenase family protein [Candidatus Latescibacterota bacterium]
MSSQPSLSRPADLYTCTHVAEPTLERCADIDEAALGFFAAQGYLSIRRAFSPSQVQAAAAAVDNLIGGSNPSFRGVQFEAGVGNKDVLSAEQQCLSVRKLMSFVDYHPDLQALAFDASIFEVLTQLMGETPVLFQNMALLKPPGGREKPWHQDMAYFNVPPNASVVGVWIALDPATTDNGALRIMPGSHRVGPQDHFKRRDWQICDTDVAIGEDVAVPLPPGGALFWHGLTQHGSPTNDSDSRRRALQFHYRPESTVEGTTEDRLQIYGGDVRGAEC